MPALRLREYLSARSTPASRMVPADGGDLPSSNSNSLSTPLSAGPTTAAISPGLHLQLRDVKCDVLAEDLLQVVNLDHR